MITCNFPIEIFDSGVGGLSVLRTIRAQMPEESVLYFGDQEHIPYGPRSMEQIRDSSEAITNFLLQYHTKIIVVACNTASAAALKYLRERFSDVQFVVMEPAVNLRRNRDPRAKWESLPKPHLSDYFLAFHQHKAGLFHQLLHAN